jgi:3-phenylpropionate/trans-cinnamate dioxygenase ferredoxin subunit
MICNWHKLDDFSFTAMQEGKLHDTLVAGKQIGLLKKGNAIYAFAATCPHAGSRLCDGWLDALGRIVCPLHNYRFDPENGRNTSGEGYKLKTYLVEVREDYIYVGFIVSE